MNTQKKKFELLLKKILIFDPLKFRLKYHFFAKSSKLLNDSLKKMFIVTKIS